MPFVVMILSAFTLWLLDTIGNHFETKRAQKAYRERDSWKRKESNESKDLNI